MGPCWRKVIWVFVMRFWSVLAMVMVAGCTLALPGSGAKKPVGVNAITGDAIAVTTLDGPTSGLPQTPGAVGGAPVAQDLSAVARAKGEVKPALGAPTPADANAVKPKPKPTATAKSAAATPVESHIASPEEVVCLRKGGVWGGAGKAGQTCIKPTKDSGKQCTKESDCEGFCLARSGTCAPAIPMFGCNDILQDNGVMVTLCID